jgi:RNA polymerase sigma factor (sigma-70 family)
VGCELKERILKMENQEMHKVDQIQEHQILNLIDKASKSDLQATQDLFEIISPRIESYCRSLTKGKSGRWEGNWKDHNDLIQDTKGRILLALNTGREKFESEEHFIRWAKTLAHNIFIDGCRRSKKERDKRATLPVRVVSKPQIEGDIWANEWLATLSEEDREMVYLNVIEGYNTREIARFFRDTYDMRLSHNLVARHLKKALKSLQTRFESDGLR